MVEGFHTSLSCLVKIRHSKPVVSAPESQHIFKLSEVFVRSGTPVREVHTPIGGGIMKVLGDRRNSGRPVDSAGVSKLYLLSQ